MSKESEKVLARIDEYLKVMESQGKPVKVVNITPKQFDTLKKAHDKANEGSKFKTDFKPRYRGVELVKYEDRA